MKLISTSIYFNDKEGYIVTSDTTIEKTLLHTVVNPAITIESDCTVDELGHAIKKGLEKSENSKPINRIDANNYKFWHLSKYKSFSAFSKKYSCIEIIKKKDKYEIAECIRDRDGSYLDSSESNDKRYLSINSTGTDIAKVIINILSKKTKITEDRFESFKTVNENCVSFIKPANGFIDIGDGHTDAYKTFIFESDAKSYISFVIDSGFCSFSDEDIRKRWSEIYGELSDYHYTELNHPTLKKSVTAHVDGREIKSLFYKDNESYLEVHMEMNLSEKKDEKEIIKREFDKVVNSIVLKSYNSKVR